MSRRAVKEALTTGKSSISTEDCLDLVPVKVGLTEDSFLDLLLWNQTALRDLCFTKLFPALWDDATFTDLRRYISNFNDVENKDFAATRAIQPGTAIPTGLRPG